MAIIISDIDDTVCRAYSSIGIKAVHPNRIGPRLMKEDTWAGRFTKWL